MNTLANITAPTTHGAYNTPSNDVPSISSAAMLVELRISEWTGRKLDKRASTKVTHDANAQDNVARVSKALLGDCAELTKIHKFVNNLRNTHKHLTMDWSDGIRLLPTAQYFTYHNCMTQAQNEFYQLVEEFLDVYDNEIITAQLKLGDLFDPNEYPTRDTISTKFAFRLSYLPVPEAGDFRVDINNEANNEIRTGLQTYYEEKFNGAMRDIWQRTYDALERMSERLDYRSYEDKDTRKVFKDTLVTNVLEIVDLLDVCNITGDAHMTAMRQQLEETLRGVTADALRTDDYLRAETKRAVDAAIKSLPSLDF